MKGLWRAKEKKKSRKIGEKWSRGTGRTCDRPNCRVGAKPSEEKRRRTNQLNAEPLVGSINDQLQIVVADGAVVAAGKLVEPFDWNAVMDFL